MAAQPDGGTPVETGSDGGDLDDRVSRLEQRVEALEKLNRELITRLSRMFGLSAKELRRLETDDYS